MKKFNEFAPLVLLCLFTTKLLVLNSWSFESAIVLLALAALSGVFQLKAKNEEIEALKEEILQQKNSILEIQKQTQEVRNAVASVKMSSNIKPAVKF